MKLENEILKRKLEHLKEEIQQIAEKNRQLEQYKIGYFALKEFFRKFDEKHDAEQDPLINSTRMIYFDLENPEIKIYQYQKEILDTKKTHGEAKIYLMDIFFQPEEFCWKNATKLKKLSRED